MAQLGMDATALDLLNNSKQEPSTPPSPEPTENKVMIMGYNVVFPSGKKPFPAQLAVMNKVLQALKTSQHALLESPTGSGKTLALLCSSLTFQRQFTQELLLEAEKIRNARAKEAELAALKKEQDQAAIRGFKKEASVTGANAGKDDALDDDDDFALTQPSFDRFRFGADAVKAVEDGWISMEHKKRALASTTSDMEPNKSKKRVLPSSFSTAQTASVIAAAVAAHHADGDQHGDFHATTYNGVQSRIKPPQIFFCSRTHSQLAQVIEELKNCPESYLHPLNESSPFAEQIKTCLLGSKAHFCVNRKINRDLSQVDELCKQALDANGCSYFRKRKQTNDLRRVIPAVWDIEDLVALAKKHRECAFFHTREALADANIVFCPYNYLLDPMIRDAVGISLKNAIIVLDEAHNVEDTCRSSASMELTADTLSTAIKAFTIVIKYGHRPPTYNVLLKILNGLNRWLQSINTNSSTILKPTGFEEESKVWSGSEALAMFAEYTGITADTLPSIKQAYAAVAELEKELASDQDSPQSAQSAEGPEEAGKADAKTLLGAMPLSTVQSVLVVVDYMVRDTLKYLDDFKLIVIKSRSDFRRSHGNSRFRGNFSQSSQGNDGWELKLCIWCLNAAVAFSDIVKNVRSVVLTSGTLSPMDSFAGELGTDFPIRLEANHVVNMRRQVFIGAIMNGPGYVDLSSTYKNQQEFRYQDSLGELLFQYAQVIPGGILMFFPSYALMDKLSTRWRQTGLWSKLETIKAIFSEPRQAGKDFDALLEEYKMTIASCAASEFHRGTTTGAIFLAVYRGKVSEGIDFSNDNARAVLAVGIPYPSVKELQVCLKRDYQDEKSKMDKRLVNGRVWYQLQAFRALNQALGRCIRHRRDYGAIILLDSRHRFQAHTGLLSKWMRPYIQEFDNSQQCVPLFQEFFERNQQELPRIHENLSAISVSANATPLVLGYEDNTVDATRSMASTLNTVKSHLEQRRQQMDQPRVFSIFNQQPTKKAAQVAKK